MSDLKKTMDKLIDESVTAYKQAKPEDKQRLNSIFAKLEKTPQGRMISAQQESKKKNGDLEL